MNESALLEMAERLSKKAIGFGDMGGFSPSKNPLYSNPDSKDTGERVNYYVDTKKVLAIKTELKKVGESLKKSVGTYARVFKRQVQELKVTGDHLFGKHKKHAYQTLGELQSSLSIVVKRSTDLYKAINELSESDKLLAKPTVVKTQSKIAIATGADMISQLLSSLLDNLNPFVLRGSVNELQHIFKMIKKLMQTGDLESEHFEDITDHVLTQYKAAISDVGENYRELKEIIKDRLKEIGGQYVPSGGDAPSASTPSGTTPATTSATAAQKTAIHSFIKWLQTVEDNTTRIMTANMEWVGDAMVDHGVYKKKNIAAVEKILEDAANDKKYLRYLPTKNLVIGLTSNDDTGKTLADAIESGTTADLEDKHYAAFLSIVPALTTNLTKMQSTMNKNPFFVALGNDFVNLFKVGGWFGLKADKQRDLIKAILNPLVEKLNKSNEVALSKLQAASAG